MSARPMPDRMIVEGLGFNVVHYYGPNGPMCGWEGGIFRGTTDAACDCSECIDLVNALWRLWFPRTRLPDHGGSA